MSAADVLAWALDGLHAEFMSEESRGLFLRHDAVDALMSMLRVGRGGLRMPLDILMRVAEHSCKEKKKVPIILEPGVGTKVTAAAAAAIQSKKMLNTFKFKWIKWQVIYKMFLF